MFSLQERHRAHDMPGIEMHGLSGLQVSRIRNFIGRNRYDDPIYQACQRCSPFLQGCQGDWVLIEFWSSNMEAIQAWVAMLNEYVFKRPVESWEVDDA